MYIKVLIKHCEFTQKMLNGKKNPTIKQKRTGYSTFSLTIVKAGFVDTSVFRLPRNGVYCMNLRHFPLAKPKRQICCQLQQG